MAKQIIDWVRAELGEAVLSSHSRLGDDTVVVGPEAIERLLLFLRDDERTQMNMLRDITAVDYLRRRPRFEIVYVLYSLEKKHQLIARCVVEESSPQVPTASGIWPIAGWMEREVWDMYGVQFIGHPDLRRVLLYEEFEGHPLRKDYAVQASQPRIELRAQERDAVEEFKHYVQDAPAVGSRADFSDPGADAPAGE